MNGVGLRHIELILAIIACRGTRRGLTVTRACVACGRRGKGGWAEALGDLANRSSQLAACSPQAVGGAGLANQPDT